MAATISASFKCGTSRLSVETSRARSAAARAEVNSNSNCLLVCPILPSTLTRASLSGTPLHACSPATGIDRVFFSSGAWNITRSVVTVRDPRKLPLPGITKEAGSSSCLSSCSFSSIWRNHAVRLLGDVVTWIDHVYGSGMQGHSISAASKTKVRKHWRAIRFSRYTVDMQIT